MVLLTTGLVSGEVPADDHARVRAAEEGAGRRGGHQVVEGEADSGGGGPGRRGGPAGLGVRPAQAEDGVDGVSRAVVVLGAAAVRSVHVWARSARDWGPTCQVAGRRGARRGRAALGQSAAALRAQAPRLARSSRRAANWITRERFCFIQFADSPAFSARTQAALCTLSLAVYI